MKRILTLIAAGLIAGALVAAIAHAANTATQNAHDKELFYPVAWIVTERDDSTKYVQLLNHAGTGLLLYAEDLYVGDIIAGVMSDNGTPNDFTDDSIVDYRFSGYTAQQ